LVNWADILKETSVDWLLEQSNPSVRYFTLWDILGKREDDPQVVSAKREIAKSPLLEKIMRKQSPNGHWEDHTSPYHPKYKSSYWTIMLLGQLGMDKTDGRVKAACEHIFRFQSDEGGFSSCTPETALKEYKMLNKNGRKLPSPDEYAASIVFEHQYSCLTGNVATALIRLGYADDQRVKKALRWLVKIQNSDGGWLCPYWRAHVKDKHGCFFGTICPVEAFSEIGEKNLTGEMRVSMERGAEFLLMHRLFKADHHGNRIINPHWLTLSFPTFTTYNILRGLDVLTRLGYVKDERLDDAVEVLMEKRQKNGTWILENTPSGRMQANIETKGEPSKWVTLIALRTLKRLYSAGSNVHQ
jgi:hypothetical protein